MPSETRKGGQRAGGRAGPFPVAPPVVPWWDPFRLVCPVSPRSRLPGLLLRLFCRSAPRPSALPRPHTGSARAQVRPGAHSPSPEQQFAHNSQRTASELRAMVSPMVMPPLPGPNRPVVLRPQPGRRSPVRSHGARVHYPKLSLHCYSCNGQGHTGCPARRSLSPAWATAAWECGRVGVLRRLSRMWGTAKGRGCGAIRAQNAPVAGWRPGPSLCSHLVHLAAVGPPPPVTRLLGT